MPVTLSEIIAGIETFWNSEWRVFHDIRALRQRRNPAEARGGDRFSASKCLRRDRQSAASGATANNHRLFFFN